MRTWAKYIWLFVIAAPFIGGFLLYQTSGLMNTGAITPTTAVAKVDGTEILYTTYQQQVQNQVQAQQQQSGRSLTEDEQRQVEDAVFNQMVSDILLQREYARRHIAVTDDEIRDFARYAPPSWIMQSPELQTDGRFDPAKYQRLLASPAARQGGLLLQLEAFYRTEIPKEKLFSQVTAGVYATDAELWRMWQDSHDSAQVTYAAWNNAPDTADVKSVTDAEMQAYYNAHLDDFKQQGHAVLSVVQIPRVVTAADSAAVRDHLLKLRAEIAGGASFADVAKRESQDSASAVNGGDLGKGVKGRFVPEFEKAMDALKPGELSGPVLTPFGYHLIKVESRKGDTVSVRHILLRIQQSDSAASRMDHEADELSRMAANAEQGSKLDSAAKKLGLTIFKVNAVEGQPAVLDGRVIPSVSAWAFGGVKAGEVSDLFESDQDGYFMARLDSLTPGGQQSFDAVKDHVRFDVAAQHHLDRMMDQAKAFASAAAATSLEAAGQKMGVHLERTAIMFARSSLVPGLGGQFTQAIGAAFKLPVGAVSAPVRDERQITVLRVDRRVTADSAAWAKQKEEQRQQRIAQLKQTRLQMFLQDLHDKAKIVDRRKQIDATLRRQTTS
jgi:peptidyl-prolyl cis-trans isomerase D